ncbi:carboxylesterase/lipase family protein [Thalassotalea atypica]|uniref:carboxylesterase/lipase family protein n=1 Tax=Thalassotalea atypica TaxID=2054316 RepID=UPI002572D072|nr:carboxylesterase family protein [Thalassotalea atypica]
MTEYKNHNEFYNINYALDVSGKNRWNQSRLNSQYNEYDSSIGFTAPQVIQASLLPDVSEINGHKIIENEQCLNLNIFTPHKNTNKSKTNKLPVMLWIHGGGFQVGSNALTAYHGEKLASSANVVVVIINYRLGALGFLRLCDITHGEIPSTGNEGLSDQITALKWVQKNIVQFGGDNMNVTLFGESAGAMSIACLLASPKAKGLFHKAILQSGGGHTYSSIEKANKVAKEFIKSAEALGYSIQDLKAISAEKLMKIQAHFLKRPEVYQQFGMLPFSPVIESSLLPIAPHTAIKQGCAKDIPLLAGSNTDEWTLFASMIGQSIDSSQALDYSLAPLMSPEISQCVIEQTKQVLQKRNKPISYQNILSEILGNYWFTEPCHRLLSNHSHAGGISYRYLLGINTVIETLGCTHGADIGYVFGTTVKELHGSSERVAELTNILQSAWSAFAYSGSPNTEVLAWPKYLSPEHISNSSNGASPFTYVFLDHEQEFITQDKSSYNQCWSQISDQQLAAF